MKKLNHPYPLGLQSWKKAIAISGLILIFLFLLQPFGLQDIYLFKRIWVILGYGLLTLFIVLFNQFILPKIFPPFFKEENWTLLSQILWLLWNTLMIAFINFYYSSFIFNLPIRTEVFFLFLLYTLLVAVFPLSIISVISYNIFLKNNLVKIELHNKKLNQILQSQKLEDKFIISSANAKEKINISFSTFLFMESVGNYIDVWYLEDNQVKNKNLRNTLKEIEKQISDIPNLCRTHRAFIVNLNQIKKITGNAQGYKLSLKNIDSEVPVSRTYLKKFNEIMKNM